MDQASKAIFDLKPVTFHYKKEIDPAGSSQFGLVAEDVEKVNPDLVVRDEEGKAYSVRYDAVNAMFLNEFLKEHRKVEQQQKQIDALTAELKEQAAHIQKVSTQLQASKAAPPSGQQSLNSSISQSAVTFHRVTAFCFMRRYGSLKASACLCVSTTAPPH